MRFAPTRGRGADEGSGAPMLPELTAGQRWWSRSWWAAGNTAEVQLDAEISRVDNTVGRGGVKGGGEKTHVRGILFRNHQGLKKRIFPEKEYDLKEKSSQIYTDK